MYFVYIALCATALPCQEGRFLAGRYDGVVHGVEVVGRLYVIPV
jgi:hypothetical protein